MSPPPGRIKVKLYFRDKTEDGYGLVEGYLNLESIDWQTDGEDTPLGSLKTGDVYQIKLEIKHEGEKPDETVFDLDGGG